VIKIANERSNATFEVKLIRAQRKFEGGFVFFAFLFLALIFDRDEFLW
jgi:hypothetical protein